MIKDLPDHYSMTEPATIYDEETLTVIELVGRLYAKVKHCIDEVNKNTENIPLYIANKFDDHLTGGAFDQQLKEYCADLEKRLDAIIGNTTEGSTTLDNEIIDARVNGDGAIMPTAGDAIRETWHNLKGFIDTFTNRFLSYNTRPHGMKYNRFNPFTCTPNTGLSNDDGTEVDATQWVTDFIAFKGGDTIYTTPACYKIAVYGSGMKFIGIAHDGSTLPDNASYVRVIFNNTDVAYFDRFKVTITNNAKYAVGYMPFYLREIDYEIEMLTHQITGKAFDSDSFIIGGLSINSKTMPVITAGTKRLVTPMPFTLLKGVSVSFGTARCRVFKIDSTTGKATMIHDDVSSFTVADTGLYMLAIRNSNNTELVAGTTFYSPVGADEILEQIIIKFDTNNTSHNAVRRAYQPNYEKELSVNMEHNDYPADITFIGDNLYVFNSSDDAHTDFKRISVYTVGANILTKQDIEITHNLGHVNSVDYSAGNNALIMGNGSNDGTLLGEIIIYPNVNMTNGAVLRYEDAIKINVGAEGWGIKTNVVWGERNLTGAYNLIYVITNNNQDVYKLCLHKSGTSFTGGYTIIDHWHTDEYIDVNQGSVFHNSTLYVGLGHEWLHFSGMHLMRDGSIHHNECYLQMYMQDGSTHHTGDYTSGIAVKDGYIYVYMSHGYIYKFREDII